MRSLLSNFPVGLLILVSGYRLGAQNSVVDSDRIMRPRVVIGDPASSAESVITVPPDTSWTTSISFAAASPMVPIDSNKFAAWLKKESATNGLSDSGLRPWHIVIAYDQFDGDGDNFDSGVLEEFWAGPKKFKRTYKSDALNQTDYGTDHGLFRLGDQRWPNRAEAQVRSEVIDPFSHAASLQGVQASGVERSFGKYTLNCFVLKNGSGGISIPAQYCFEDNGSILRYARGSVGFRLLITTSFHFRIAV